MPIYSQATGSPSSCLMPVSEAIIRQNTISYFAELVN